MSQRIVYDCGVSWEGPEAAEAEVEGEETTGAEEVITEGDATEVWVEEV